ncbi:hypothetical protein LOC67_24855 [Stieleria sp. JC731]|nr:hypothetical protein [Stieleria sp. JC731]MCC9603794.1 hypothetical protein [Stieleria sp. JC731]
MEKNIIELKRFGRESLLNSPMLERFSTAPDGPTPLVLRYNSILGLAVWR